MLTMSIIFWIMHLTGASDDRCPYDKPYFSDTGCISECPEPFYINGSNCVGDCGKWFVAVNRTCVESCPNETYSKETLRQVYDTQYLERKCIACSNENEYIMNGTCVNACPDMWRTLDQRRCMTQCPEDRPFKLKKTILNHQHYVCTDKCPSLQENDLCVDACSENKVVFNSSCLRNCPPLDPVLLSNECFSECPSTAISTGPFNSACIYQCNVDKPFVSYNSCVSQCPDIAKLKMDKNGLQLCVNKCDKGDYMHNDYCVSSCPASTVAVNNSCIKSCPRKQSFSCMVKKERPCGTEPRENLDHKICVDDCPEKMFILNRSCVYSCPDGMPSFNKECTDICPVDNPYLYNSTITERCYTYSDECVHIRYLLKCTDKCPDNTYIYNKLCLPYCPNNTLYNDNTCVEQCPLSKSYKQISSLTFSTWELNGSRWDKSFSKVKTSIDIYKCVPLCPREMFKFNLKCLRSCPGDYRFVRNMACTRDKCETRYTYSNVSGVFCMETCDTFYFELNGTCVDSCPDSYFVFNKSCEERCPESHPYSFKPFPKSCNKYSGKCSALKEVITCVSKCPNNTYVNNKQCSGFCPKPLFTYGNECVKSCPESSKFIDSTFLKVKTRTRSTYTRKLESRTINQSILRCVSVCPDNKAAVGSKCESTCPVHSRFIHNGYCSNGSCNTTLMFHSSAGIVCTNTCPSGRYEFNKTCVLQCPNSFFSLKQRCVTKCNKGQILNNETIPVNPQRCKYEDATCVTNFLYDIQCRYACPGTKFLWNNTCLHVCPDSTLTFNKTCVTKCPDTDPYISRHYVKLKVWEYSYYSGIYEQTEKGHEIGECVQNCSNLKSENTCVETCPTTRSLLIGDKCFNSCPSGTLSDFREKKCVRKCPNDMIKQFQTCRIKCESYELFKDGKCINDYECTNPMFAFAGQCLRICPDGYVWFVSCNNLLAVGLSMAVLFLVPSASIIFGRHVFTELLTITWLIFIKENRFHEYLMKKYSQPEIKSVYQTEKIEEVILLDDLDNSDDDVPLLVRTRCDINGGEIESVL